MVTEIDIIPKSRKMADSWWGRSWASNLESYADYENRIARGRSYLRNGAVREIDIEKGMVSATVQGSRPKPYKVKVEIMPISETRKKEVVDRCGDRISNLDALISGDIPEDIADMFVSKGGLFPSPREIKFRCTCPDYAYMCKHVAAVLYGIGVVFDRNPLLFFELRGMDVDSLIRTSVEARTEKMLKNSGNRTPRMLDDADIDELFGVLRGSSQADHCRSAHEGDHSFPMSSVMAFRILSNLGYLVSIVYLLLLRLYSILFSPILSICLSSKLTVRPL